MSTNRTLPVRGSITPWVTELTVLEVVDVTPTSESAAVGSPSVFMILICPVVAFHDTTRPLNVYEDGLAPWYTISSCAYDPVPEVISENAWKNAVLVATFEVNAKIGGSKTSAHMSGNAADIKVVGLDAHQIVEAIRLADLDFDQLVAYSPSRGAHVHIGIRAGQWPRHRHQLLWAPASGGYEAYKAP